MADYIPSTPNNFLAVRAELDKIAEAIASQLDRDGTTPNYMEADLDMNGHDILNFVIDSGETVDSVFGRTGDVVAEVGDYSEFYLQDLATSSIDDLSDVSLVGNQIGYILAWNGNQYVPAPMSGGGGSETFLELQDTPANYLGSANFLMAVNPTEDGVVFTDNIDSLIDTIDGGAF